VSDYGLHIQFFNRSIDTEPEHIWTIAGNVLSDIQPTADVLQCLSSTNITLSLDVRSPPSIRHYRFMDSEILQFLHLLKVKATVSSVNGRDVLFYGKQPE
jgi:hypothetical protein